MMLLIALPVLAIYVVALGLTLMHLRGESKAETMRDMTRMADNYAARFDDAFREAAAIAITTARAMEVNPDLSDEQVFALLQANVLQNPAVYGAAMAFEPGTRRGDDVLFCPYVYRGADGPEQMDINREVYDWYADPQWQWWQIPKRVTYSAPFFRDGELHGVTTVDIMLPTLQQNLAQDILDNRDFVILTATGQYVYNKNPALIMTRTLFDVAAEDDNPELVAVAKEIVSGKSGTASVSGWGDLDEQWVFYAPIESAGWAFAARISARKALAGVRERMTVAAVAMGMTLVMMIVCIGYASGRIAKPIAKLRSMVLQIAGGDLDSRVEGITSRDEIGELAESFNTMTADLRSHVDRLATEHAEREKLERDLDLAREIQRSLLPKGEPNAPGFEIAGWNLWMDKTGGDYFDWLDVPDGRIILTLADVTGHGIGPALIVAACRAYMRASTSAAEMNLEQAIAHVNDLLHADMPEDRFITAVVGLLEPATARMKLISAGQAPLLFYEAATDTVHNWNADGPPLAVIGGVDFAGAREIEFRSGDMLVLTTDGFFEWPDPSGEEFGIDRLVEFVKCNHTRPPQDLISALREAVVAHGGGTEQGDDLTAVVVRKS
jgi:sigma-B regulation protein RsbU (phosphoserine phosphatase)